MLRVTGPRSSGTSPAPSPRCAGRPHAMNYFLGAADVGLGPPNPPRPRDWSTNGIHLSWFASSFITVLTLGQAISDSPNFKYQFSGVLATSLHPGWP